MFFECVVKGGLQTKGFWLEPGTGMVEQEEKLQVALFSTKLFTEEIDFLFNVLCSFIFSQMKAPDNMWFMAFQPSEVFFSF